jgi:hypothetical protein
VAEEVAVQEGTLLLVEGEVAVVLVEVVLLDAPL